MDLWQTLAATDKTVVMYGMGNGADKILAVCRQYGIEVREFFASDDFVRGQQFHGKTVRRFSDVCAQYGADNLVVLVSFASSLPDVMDNIARVASVCETYIPDVPVKGDTLFCEAYEREHQAQLEAACAALSEIDGERGAWYGNEQGTAGDLRRCISAERGRRSGLL